MIEKRISAGSYPSVNDLCSMFEIKPRTLHQDIRELKERLGVDIRFNKAKGGYYNASPLRQLPSFRLSTEEYLVLSIAQKMLAHYCGPTFDVLSSTALQKLIPDNLVSPPDIVTASVAFCDRAPEISLKLFLHLLKACHEKNPLEIETDPNGKRRILTVAPQRLIFQKNEWLLAGHAEEHGGLVIPLKTIVGYSMSN
jgi:predicted DNA-binding transcriptional regulator YafY